MEGDPARAELRPPAAGAGAPGTGPGRG